MASTQIEHEREIARREAAVVEAARVWARADRALKLRGIIVHEVVQIARMDLHAAVTSLEDLTGPLPEVQP